MDIAEEKRRQLKQLFPEAFTETRDSKTGELKHAVDWEKLKASLGEVLEREGERFGLSWPGKSGLLKVIQQPSVGTLKPCREESVNFDETENLFIEGDNLEVLKLLQKSYFGKVKMIYIDPPYNTGNEFVYPDNFTESLETYLQSTGMVDAQGRKFSTNTNAEGRFHSKWLNMMYPRLFLARNLLREDGVIFISIDDNEVKNLRCVCDEIFGEESFLAQLVWQKIHSTKNDAKYFSDSHEYILCYAKSIESSEIKLLPRTAEMDARFTNPDNDPRGPWSSGDLVANEERSGGYFEVTGPTGKTYNVPQGKHWVYSQDNLNRMIKEGRIWFGRNGDAFPRLKRYLTEVQQGRKADTLWLSEEVGHNQEAKRETKRIFDGESYFDTPKPVRLMKRCMELVVGKEDTVLDFFSGSCSTAHAVLDLNKEDGGNRKFIMVQLPEPCDENSEAFKAGYKTIADIGKERIRRVIQKIEKEQDGQLDLGAGAKKQDLGFKVFKLSKSNFKLWEGNETNPSKLKQQMELHINHIDPNASEEDILYELLLKAGFPLTTKVDKISIADKSVYSIAEGALIICLDNNLTKEAIEAIAALKPVQCLCLDSAFPNNDQLKTNAVQIMESAKVQFRTV
jgi:adenine-specific DNA-methyltransferase